MQQVTQPSDPAQSVLGGRPRRHGGSGPPGKESAPGSGSSSTGSARYLQQAAALPSIDCRVKSDDTEAPCVPSASLNRSPGGEVGNRGALANSRSPGLGPLDRGSLPNRQAPFRPDRRTPQPPGL